MTEQARFTPTLDRIVDTRRRNADLRRPQRRDIRRPPGYTDRDVWRRIIRGEVPSLEFFNDLSQYEPLAYANLPRADLYLLNDPELIWDLFVNRPTIKGFGLQSLRPVVGDGILTSEGAKHRSHRAMVQPAFTGRQIAGYGDDMIGAIEALDGRWRQSVADEAHIELVPDMSALTLDIVGRTLFGLDLAAMSDTVGPALTDALEVFNVTVHPKWEVLSRYPSRTRRKLVHAVERMDVLVGEILTAKRAELAAGTPARDMLTVLITATDDDTGAPLTDDEIRDEALTLMLAGHETTAMLLSWTWLLLFQNPDVKLWVTQEWDDAAAGEPLTSAAVGRMPRTRAVLAEVLRLRPPAWLLDRIVTEDVVLGDYVIPEGAVVMANQFTMHRDPRFWPDADRFKPTRWLTADGDFTDKIAPKGAYFPFGFAARKCIGDRFALAEAMLALAILGSRWHILPISPSAVRPEPSVTLRPSTPIPAHLRPRNTGTERQF